MTLTARWLCCHLGAREHYAIPRALHHGASLGFMLTDAWAHPGGLLGHLPGVLLRRLAERFHEDLATADVRDLTASVLRQEAGWRLRRRSGWDLMIARNEWFQRAAADSLLAYREKPGERVVVFAHSYSARTIFQVARARGWMTVLGQIDPGEQHFTIVDQLAARAPAYGPPPPAPPVDYFERWRQECALADRIVVNSHWSREALERAGIPQAKLHVVPLVYEPPAGSPRRDGRAAVSFSSERPLRLLFAGHVSVVKGASALIEAMRLLAGLPVTLRLVGEPGMTIPHDLRSHPAIEWIGAVSRGEMVRHYLTSDVLVFPSQSDGFGLVQIEAQAHGLPLIASRFCGDVVHDGINGLRLSEVTPTAIATAVRALIAEPQRLAQFAAQATPPLGTGLANLGGALRQLATP